jgi:two-component system chemotaxis response regulator CheB
MNPIRVLIVDDSVVARRLITNALSVHPEVAVVGTAENGALALAKLPHLSPDAVILDVEMPEMDGIATLKLIRELYPLLPVIMFSSLTERGARVTFDALAAGANDYALKPSAQSGESLDQVVTEVLVPKLVAVVRASGAAAARARMAGATHGKEPARAATLHANRARPELVVIASATGGPNALAELIPRLPHDLPVPVLVVQHMPPIFTRCLAERLTGRSAVDVIESAGGEPLRPGCVYIAPGNFHLELVREGELVKTRLSEAAPEHGCRPAADVLFRSAAQLFGPKVLGVVLTGMGSDGKLGSHAIVQAGGRVIAQSGPSCVVWGMPRAVEEAGLCEAVLPLHELAGAICELVSREESEPRHAHSGA